VPPPCPIGASCQSKTASEQKVCSLARLLASKCDLGHRLVPEVGPGFKVFKEDVLSVREEKTSLGGEQPMM